MTELVDIQNNNLEHILRTIRKHSGLNQKEIASKLNVNQSTYSKIERGLVSTTAENWLMFAHLLGLNFDAPLTGFIEVISNENKKRTDHNMIPKRYSSKDDLSSRLFFHFLKILNQMGYKQQIDDFFLENKIDSDYFRINNNYFDSLLAEDLFRKINITKNHTIFSDQLNLQQLETLFGKQFLNTKNGFYFIKDFIRKKGHLENILSYEWRSSDQSQLILVIESPASELGKTIRSFVQNSIQNVLDQKFKDIQFIQIQECETIQKVEWQLN